MVRTILAALCGMSVMLPAGEGGPTGGQPAAAVDEQTLKGLAGEWKSAYNAKDAAAVASLYAADAYYVSAHVIAHGRREIQAYFQRGIDGGGHIDALELLALGGSGVLAYWVGTYEATNAGRKVRGRNIVVVRKVGDRWLIVAHESVEADQP